METLNKSLLTFQRERLSGKEFARKFDKIHLEIRKIYALEVANSAFMEAAILLMAYIPVQ